MNQASRKQDQSGLKLHLVLQMLLVRSLLAWTVDALVHKSALPLKMNGVATVRYDAMP